MKTSNTLSIKVKSKTSRDLEGDSEVEMMTEWNLKRIIYAVIVVLIFIILPAYYFNLEDDSTKNDDTTGMESEPEQQKQALTKEIVVEQVTPQALSKEPASLGENSKANNVLEKEPAVQAPLEGSAVQAEVKPKTVVIEKAVQHKPPRQPIKTEYLNPHITRAELAQGMNKLRPYGQVELPFLVGEKTRGLYFFTEIKNMKGNAVFHEWLREGKSIYKRKVIIRGNRWRFYTSKLFTQTSIGQWQVRVITKQGEVLHKINFSVEKR
ncbi:MAG: DUF2914 domain-containing protein [Methyloprofundus sp.]|nr:DUF2914 domain-containing protein [Methyloprofundus sp.]